MDQQQLYVKMALHAWEVHIKRTNGLLDSLTDEQLLQEIAPGKNRVIYILGHLVAIHDAMLPLLGLGEASHANLYEIFVTKPDRAVNDLPAVQEMRHLWVSVNEQLAQHFNKLPAADWFLKHSRISDEDFAKEPHRNRLSVLINRTNHVAYHLGQIVLVKPKNAE